MQQLNADPKQNTMPDGMVSFAVRSNQFASNLQDIACVLGISESDVKGLADDGLINAIRLRSGEWLFPPIDKLVVLWGESTSNTSTASEMQAQVRTLYDDNIFNNNVDHDFVSESNKPGANQSATLDNTQPQVQSTKGDQSDLKKPLTIAEVCNFEHTHKLFSARNKRTPLIIENTRFKGLKLEGSEFRRKLIVKTKAVRCVLFEWTNLDDIQTSVLEKYIERYEYVFNQLKRRPETEEYKLYSQQLKTVGDVIRNHLKFNIPNKHSEKSGEINVINSLIRLHLSKDVEVTLPSKRKEVINLMDEQFCSFTIARYNAYLETFRATNGTHDKIVTRVKAAFNFAFDEKLIAAVNTRPFVIARKINRERHIEIPGEHMKLMFEYLDDHENPDFVFFMNLQSSGHFRYGQVMSLRFTDFDFAHNFVRVKPKGGKEVTIHLPKDVVSLVAKRKEQFKARGLQADYIFPSKQSKTGHKADFYAHWHDMLEELGFYTLDSDGEKQYQYQLHDFRETLLGRLLEFDEYTLGAALGHLSLHAVKRYKKANTASNKLAAEKGHLRKENMISREPLEGSK